MSLYCDPPPPLLDANKVCKGNSKVGIGCEDDLDTGICKRSGALKDCQSACRKTEHCEIVVLYTDAMTGTCVLWCALAIYYHPCVLCGACLAYALLCAVTQAEYGPAR